MSSRSSHQHESAVSLQPLDATFDLPIFRSEMLELSSKRNEETIILSHVVLLPEVLFSAENTAVDFGELLSAGRRSALVPP
eukprot:s2152_g6.t1